MNLHRLNGPSHLETLHARRIHAESMGHLGYYDKSLKELKKILEEARTSLGDFHHQVSFIMLS